MITVIHSYSQSHCSRSYHLPACHVVALVLLVLTACGCFNARIGTGATTTNRRDTTVAMTSYLWGTVSDDTTFRNDSLNAFSDIEITQDFGQVAVSLITLGLYVPMTAHCYYEKCSDRGQD
jgi:hypothetical protein